MSIKDYTLGSDKIAPQYIEGRIITLTFPKEARK